MVALRRERTFYFQSTRPLAREKRARRYRGIFMVAVVALSENRYTLSACEETTSNDGEGRLPRIAINGNNDNYNRELNFTSVLLIRANLF